MENKPPFFVCSLSGGKDSSAMLLRLLEENRPVDMILFCDTGLEFPDISAHFCAAINPYLLMKSAALS